MHLASNGLKAELGAQEPPSTLARRRPIPRLQGHPGQSGGPATAPARARRRRELKRILAHEDAHVGLGLCQQTVRVDKLATVPRLKRVPLVHVTVHEDGALIVMGHDAMGRTCQSVVDGTLRARASSSSQVMVMKSTSHRPFFTAGRRPEPRAPDAILSRQSNRGLWRTHHDSHRRPTS